MPKLTFRRRRHLARLNGVSDAVSTAPREGMGESVMRGGRILAVRQFVGLLVGGGGGFLLLRLIGPREYGTYAAAFTIGFFAQTMAELNLDLYLVRRASISQATYNVVFSLLAVFSMAATLILLVSLPLISAAIRIPNFPPVAAIMFLSLPLVHAQQVPLSRLERELQYAEISRIEMFAQVIVPAVAVPLAISGFGVWAAVAGWWAQQVALLLTLWRTAPVRPRLDFQRTEVFEALNFGAASIASTGAYATRNLVAPLLLGHLLGSPAVGYVSLIQRILDSLALAKQVIYRISIAVLARIINERDRLLSAVADAALIQSVTVGVPVAVFAAAGPFLIPAIFGAAWAPVITLLPLVGMSYLVWTVFSVETACLQTLPRPWCLVIVNGANSLLLWVGSIAFVPHLGIKGYAFGELMSMASCLVLHAYFVRRFGAPHLSAALVWLVCACAACGLSLFTPVALLILLLPLLIPQARRRLLHYVGLAVGGRTEKRLSSKAAHPA